MVVPTSVFSGGVSGEVWVPLLIGPDELISRDFHENLPLFLTFKAIVPGRQHSYKGLAVGFPNPSRSYDLNGNY